VERLPIKLGGWKKRILPFPRQTTDKMPLGEFSARPTTGLPGWGIPKSRGQLLLSRRPVGIVDSSAV
jgi:hypothetical protein